MIYSNKHVVKIKNNATTIINRFEEKHGSRYDYSKVNYIKFIDKIEIICKYHGGFWQSPHSHLKGRGCPKCAKIKLNVEKKDSINAVIRKFKKTHGLNYDYSKVNYINSKTKVEIICPEHGSFWQRPNDHINGVGCPKCRSMISKPEIEVQDFIKSLGFKIQCNNRKILNGKELDIFIPSLNKAIEFNGIYYHYSKKYFTPGKHSTKSKLCKLLNINLLHLREDLWNRDKEKMKKVIHEFLKYEK